MTTFIGSRTLIARPRAKMGDLTGKPAVPFRLRDSNGGLHLLEDYGGSWLLMVFHRHLG